MKGEKTMARTRYITRNCHTITCMVFYVLEGSSIEPQIEKIAISGHYKDEKDLIKKAQEFLSIPNAKVYHVEVVDETDEIRLMTEAEWMKYSHTAPTRTRMN